MSAFETVDGVPRIPVGDWVGVSLRRPNDKETVRNQDWIQHRLTVQVGSHQSQARDARAVSFWAGSSNHRAAKSLLAKAASALQGFDLKVKAEKVTPMGADAKTAMKVEMTDAAAKRIARIVAGEPGKTALRVSVEGGGCSGFSYKFDLVADANDDDVAIEKDGATVLIDDLSLVYMGGSVIDFVDDLMGQSFQIRNPNAVASCGCGTSFSI